MMVVWRQLSIISLPQILKFKKPKQLVFLKLIFINGWRLSENTPTKMVDNSRRLWTIEVFQCSKFRWIAWKGVRLTTANRVYSSEWKSKVEHEDGDFIYHRNIFNEAKKSELNRHSPRSELLKPTWIGLITLQASTAERKRNYWKTIQWEQKWNLRWQQKG